MLLPLVLLALAAPPAPEAAALPDAPAVVQVRGGAWLGSGVVWDAERRRVLTALHVVEQMPADAIVVIEAGGSPVAARVVDRDPRLDLALLEVEGALRRSAPVGAASALAPGEPIALFACPGGRCAQREGRVIAPARAFAGSRYLAVAAEARPGASGGAVLDARGALVGIVDLTLAREPGLALAVPVERALLRFPRS